MAEVAFSEGFPHHDYSDQFRNYFCTVLFAHFFLYSFVFFLLQHEVSFREGFSHQDYSDQIRNYVCTAFFALFLLYSFFYRAEVIV